MISENLAAIHKGIAAAAQRAGRKTEEISLLAVSKTVSAANIKAAMNYGQTLFGENYMQEAEEKINLLPKKAHWHFIGHLQSNKVAKAVALFDMIQTVDRLKIAQALDKQAKTIGKELSVLIQVNIGKEKQKSGVLPEQAEELISEVRQETDLRVLGLMAMPPYDPDPQKSRPYFSKLNRLMRHLAKQRLFDNNDTPALSMGLSHDYEVAIEEGATIVRIGTALFGSRS